MKRIIFSALAITGLALGAAAFEDDDLGEQPASTDTAKPAEEEDYQVVIQESDSDLAAFVRDYITKDSQLKGAFFIENRAKKQVLKLKLVSLGEKSKAAPDGSKTLTAHFEDSSGKSHEVLFSLQSSSFGGTEIVKIELKAGNSPAGAAPKAK
jgi:hypothetical protein